MAKFLDVLKAAARAIAGAFGISGGGAALIGEGAGLIATLLDSAANGNAVARAKLVDIFGAEAASTVERRIDEEVALRKFGPR